MIATSKASKRHKKFRDPGARLALFTVYRVKGEGLFIDGCDIVLDSITTDPHKAKQRIREINDQAGKQVAGGWRMPLRAIEERCVLQATFVRG